MAEELLAYRLATQHNLRFLVRLMTRMRAAILDGRFEDFATEFLSRYRPTDEETRLAQRARWEARRSVELSG